MMTPKTVPKMTAIKSMFGAAGLCVVLFLADSASAGLSTTAYVQFNGTECNPYYASDLSKFVYNQAGIKNNDASSTARVACPVVRAALDSDGYFGFKYRYYEIYLYITGTSTLSCDLVRRGASGSIIVKPFAKSALDFGDTKRITVSTSDMELSDSSAEWVSCMLPPKTGIRGFTSIQALNEPSGGAARSPLTPFPP